MDLLPISFYAFGCFLTMVVLAIVNSKIRVDTARPTDAGPVGLPLYFAHAHRDFVDLGLVRSNQEWAARVVEHFGEGEELAQAGEDLRLLGRPGLSLLAAATVGFSLGYGWKPADIMARLEPELARLGIPGSLEGIEELAGGRFAGKLTVGPWSRRLEFRVPGDVYREVNTVLEPEGYRIMQFATGGLSHAFALMHLPLARKMFQSAMFDLVDPPGGDELIPGGTTDRWYTWLY